ncbi:hypothetical protein ESCO_002378 [Escovopsis weberi]|uniref:Uncharacterized protein n=1 Tax=Escovopsis weberi TaxID=150374 RepID=A0A0M8N0F3_ESCWE|nr:hypothetical protein ESCO_002378 [Escovopsis weberi]
MSPRPGGREAVPKPVSAAALAALEARRRDANRELGACRTGCPGLDDYVLLGGGLERGSVVGISAEEEDGFGVVLGLQVLVGSLLEGRAASALVITPRPAGVVLRALRDGITAALCAAGAAKEALARERAQCLDRVMLSCVFDVDGLCEVLDELERQAAPGDGGCSAEAQAGGAGDRAHGSTTQRSTASVEIGDSQDKDDEEGEGEARAAASSPRDGARGGPQLPDIVVITHFSAILTSLYTQRERSAAHDTLQRLAFRLRRLSRTLPSQPLVLLLNSTDSTNPDRHHGRRAGAPQPTSPEHGDGAGLPSPRRAVDPTLRSVFAPPAPLSDRRTNKPSFGMLFVQLLDLHLLCTRVPTAMPGAAPRHVNVIEVLLDEMGLWEGKRGGRMSREQRWAAFDVQGGRIVDMAGRATGNQGNGGTQSMS